MLSPHVERSGNTCAVQIEGGLTAVDDFATSFSHGHYAYETQDFRLRVRNALMLRTFL